MYRKWRHPDGRKMFTFATLTVNADGHSVFQRMHRAEDEKRLVVILDPADYGRRLSCPLEEASRFFKQWHGTLEVCPQPRSARVPKARSVMTARAPSAQGGARSCSYGTSR